MSKIIVSYVLSTLAGVADVSPSNVETSMLNGTIVLRNVALRPTFLPGILFDSANIDKLVVRLPILTSDAPIVAHATGTTFVFPLDLAGPPSERAFTDVQAAITNVSVLGYNPVDAEVNSAVNDAVEMAVSAVEIPCGGSPTAERVRVDGGDESLTCSFTSAALPPAADDDNGDDDDDLLSCNSAGDRTGADSSTASDAETDMEEEEPAQGFFARWRSKAVRGFGKRWRHATRIELEHAKVILPCDTRTGLNYEAHVDSLVVTIEPQEMMENEQLSVHRLELRGIRVLAHIDDTNEPRVVDVDALNVTLTSVYHPKSGRLLRKNTAVAFDGTCAVIADESTLFALLKCQMTRDIMMRLPDYCRPFASMRRDRSLWKYVGCCLLKQIQDRKHRFNCTLAHLRFFADSRRRYMELLDACHRAHDVDTYRQQLAEAEQDLRYMDVILFLRQRVRDKYGPPPPSPAATLPAHASLSPVRSDTRASPTSAAEAPPFSSRPPISSVHVGFEQVRIELPDRQAVLVSNARLVMRDAEQLMQVGDVTLISGDRSQSLARPAENASAQADDAPAAVLLSVERRTQEGFVNTRIVLAESCACLQMRHLLATAKPLLDTIIQIGLRERFPLAAAPSDAPSTKAAASAALGVPLTETIIAVVPRFSCRLDDLHLLIDRCSATYVAPPEEPPQFGCTVREVSVQTMSDKVYVLSPVVVSMPATAGGVLVSDVEVRIRPSLWAYFREAARQLPSIPLSLATASAAAATAAQVAATPPPSTTHAELQATAAVQHWSKVGAHPIVKLARFSLAFEPMATVVTVSRVEVVTVQKAHSSTKPSCLRMAVDQVSATYRDAASSLCLTTGLPEGLSVFLLPEGYVLACVPSVRAGYTLPPSLETTAAARGRGGPTTEVPLLAVRATSVCVVRNTIRLDVAGVVLADAAELGSVRGMIVSDLNAIPSSSHPYRASFVQGHVALKRVSLAPLQKLDTALLAAIGEDVLRFLLDDLVPTRVYESFFSAFSDMAVNLVADACPVELVASEAGEEPVCVRLSLQPPGGRAAGSAVRAAGVVAGPADRAQLAISPPPDSLATAARRTDLSDFGPSLFSATEQPLVLRVDARRRALILDVESFELVVAHPAQDTTLKLCAYEVAVEAPIGVMDFWSEDVRHKLPIDPSLCALHFGVTLLGRSRASLFDGHLREVDVYTGPRSAISAAAAVRPAPSPVAGSTPYSVSVSTSPTTVPNGTARVSHQHGCAYGYDSPFAAADQRSPSVESELGSFTSALPSGPSNEDPSRQAPRSTSLLACQVTSWAAQVNLSAAQDVYEGVLHTAATLCADVPSAVVAAAARKRCVITSSCQDRTFDLDRIGQLVVDNVADLLVMDACTFTTRHPLTSRVVVTNGTSVLFRHCTFPCQQVEQTRFVQPAGPMAVILCDETCAYAALPFSEDGIAAPSPAPTSAVESTPAARPRPLRRHSRRCVDVVCGRLTVQLPAQRVLEVAQQQALHAEYTGGSRPTSAWRASVRPLQCAVLYRTLSDSVDACVAVCPCVLLDVDARATTRRQALAITAALTVEEVCVPLDSAAPAAFRCLSAAAAAVQAARRRRDAATPRTTTAAPLPPRVAAPVPHSQRAAATGSGPGPGSAMTPLPLLWGQWKVLVSTSLIPIRVCLPNPTVTVAKLTLSNAILWSVKELAHTTATVEGRFAVTDVFVRDLRAECLAPVLQTSTFLDIQGAFTAPQSAPGLASASSHKVTLAVRLPHTELTVNTDQVRLLTTLLQKGVGAPPSGETEDQPCLFPPPGTVVQSFLGATSVQLQTTSGETLRLDSLSRESAGVALLPPRQSLDVPSALVEVDQALVARTVELSFERGVAAEGVALATPSCQAPRGTSADAVRALARVPVLSRKHYGVALSDGRRLLCSATLLTNGTMWLTLRSLITVVNRGPCTMCFRSDFSAPWPLDAGTVGSLPMHVADTIGQLSVSVGEQACPASLQEVLWRGESPSAMVAKWATPSRWLRSRQEPPVSAISAEDTEFVLLKDGSSVCLRVTTTRVTAADGWMFLQIAISSSAPQLRNGTHVPLSVELRATTGGAPPLSFTVAPMQTLTLTGFSAATTSYQYRLALEVKPGVWASTADNDAGGGDSETTAAPTTWLHARAAVRFSVPASQTPTTRDGFFFTAALEEEEDSADGAGYVLSARGLVRLANLSGVPLSLIAESARVPVGSSACYVPRRTPLYIALPNSAGSAMSESFELDDPSTASSRSGAFVSLGGSASDAIRDAQRCLLIRPAATEGTDFVIQAPTWLVNETSTALDFVWKLDDSTDADAVVTLTVPAGGRTPFSWLPASGCKGHFRFQPVEAGAPPSAADRSVGMSSPRIPGEWNPGTWQSFVVQCSGSAARLFFPVQVRKGRFCDAAVIAVCPPCLPPLKIINASHAAFKDVPALRTRLVNRCIRPGDSVQLMVPSGDGGPLWVPLDADSSGRARLLETGDEVVWHRITADEPGEASGRRVVAVVIQDAAPCAPGPVSVPLASQLLEPNASTGFVDVLRTAYGLDLSLTLQRVSCVVAHRDTISVRAAIDSVRVWADLASASRGRRAAVQCTVEGLQVQNIVAQAGVPVTTTDVVSPFGLNLSARDAGFQLSARRVDVASLQMQVRPLVLTVSDVFLYTLQQLLSESWDEAPKGLPLISHDMDRETDVVLHTVRTAAPPLCVLVKITTISEARIEISYDRTVVPPDDYTLLRDVPMIALLPSLYHARVVLNARVFRNLGGTSVQRATTPMLESYVNDVLTQLPSTIRSVGFFRSTSFLQAAASKLAGLFSSGADRSQGMSPPDGNALL